MTKTDRESVLYHTTQKENSHLEMCVYCRRRVNNSAASYLMVIPVLESRVTGNVPLMNELKSSSRKLGTLRAGSCFEWSWWNCMVQDLCFQGGKQEFQNHYKKYQNCGHRNVPIFRYLDVICI